MSDISHLATADFEPVLLLEADLANRLPDVTLVQPVTGRVYTRAMALVRAYTHPLGYVSLSGAMSADAYAGLIWDTLRDEIAAYLQANNLPSVSQLDAAGLSAVGKPQYVQEREALLHNAPFMSVIVTTQDRPDSLSETVRSIAAVRYPNYEIVVVDNAPSTPATADCVKALQAEIANLRYVCEPRKGLCWARNCGLDAAQGEITVFTDDDVLVDPDWLTVLAAGFRAGHNVGCVTGLILAREIETPAQLWCQEHGGFMKGFMPNMFDLDQHRPDDPLYPYRVSIFGSGANMAFKTAALREVGGSDPALGAGTPARSAAEFPSFYGIITRGYQIAYQPAAVIYHAHHARYEKFRRQFFGYGVGFTAFLTKCILDDPKVLLDLLRKVPYGLYFALSPNSPRHQTKSAAYPKELNRLELLGMLYGPFAYLRSRYRMSRQMKSFSHGMYN